MNEVRLDPQQALARAELLLAADFGREARGRPIYGRLESEDGDAGEPGPRLKLGAVRTRRLAVSEGTVRPSGSAYGNPLGGTRDNASGRPHRSALGREDRRPRHPRVARLPGGADRAASSTTGGSSTTRPTRSWRSPSCGRPRRRAPRRRCDAPSRGSPATRARKRSRGGSPPRRPGGRAPRRSPGRGWPGGGGGAPSRGKAAAHDITASGHVHPCPCRRREEGPA